MISSIGGSRGSSRVGIFHPRELLRGELMKVDVMTGFNGTLFCYGQTGSGKTWSKLPEIHSGVTSC